MLYRSELKKSAGKSGSSSSTADKKSSSGDEDIKNIFDRLESSEKGGVIGSDGNKPKAEGDSDSEVCIHYSDVYSQAISIQHMLR